MEVYDRINEELKERKQISKKEEESVNSGFVKADITTQRKLSLNSEIPLSSVMQESKGLLQRKHSMAFEVDIPSFLNDKKQRKDKENSISPKKDGIDKPSLKPFVNGNLNINLYLKIKLLKKFRLEFEKGLFDLKVDFDPSDDMDNFKICKKQSFDYELKEIEIKSAIFNAVPEDLFFSLD